MNRALSISAHIATLVRSAGERAQSRFWEFFVNNVRNPHVPSTRGHAIGEIHASCEQRILSSIMDIEALRHISNYEPCERGGRRPCARAENSE